MHIASNYCELIRASLQSMELACLLTMIFFTRSCRRSRRAACARRQARLFVERLTAFYFIQIRLSNRASRKSGTAAKPRDHPRGRFWSLIASR
ncbi:hypothetical protein EVAR_43986_1 [Eumeta japonica]|uniref:Uncharacterized protein n=1 Tax=Eumeta variegata TaxID=151549 RepID=A0A4C1XCE1_EUMVA|nr:hypothetical protein EVAR_43986_1 [Eumeta japonica]